MNYKHGCTVVKERDNNNPKWRAHIAWLAMKKRCDNPNPADYKNYKGRGISYTSEWKDFNSFLTDMGLPPSKTSLDRINNEGNYEPSNCRWATKKEQMRNTRHNRYLEHDGKRMMICEWAEYLGVPSVFLRVRLGRNWSVERTLTLT